jgi:hypothetical protein
MCDKEMREVLEDCEESFVMLLYGVQAPRGAPHMAGGCSEREAIDACRNSLSRVRVALLRKEG